MLPIKVQYDDYIHFGDARHGEEFQKLHQDIKELAYIASAIALVSFKEKLMTTSIYRKKTNDSGSHEAMIAIDFAPMTTMEKTYRLIEIMNSIYTYDPARPHMLVAEPPYHGTNAHIHLQAREFTTVLSPEQLGKLTVIASEDKAKFVPMKLGVAKDSKVS